MVGHHLTGGHLPGQPDNCPCCHRHQLGGPASRSVDPAPRGYGLPHVPYGLQPQRLGGPSPGPAGYVLLLPGSRAVPHRPDRLPQRGAVHHRLVPLLSSTLLSDHHIPLLFTAAFPLIRLDKPCPHTVFRTPEYHLGRVALSPAETANFQGSVLRKRALDPQLAPERWLKGLQWAIYDWPPRYGQGPGTPLSALAPLGAPGRAGSPLESSPATLPGAQHAPLRRALYSDSPKHIGHLCDGGTRPQNGA